MATVKLTRESLQGILKMTQLPSDQREAVSVLIGTGARTVNVTLDIDELPDKFLAGLLNEPSLNVNQRAMISMRVHGVRGERSDYLQIYRTPVSTPIEFASTFAALGVAGPNCEFFLAGRWYPIILGTHCYEDESKIRRTVSLTGTLSVGDTSESLYLSVSQDLFRGPTGEAIEPTVEEVLQTLGLRGLTESNVDYNLRLLSAERRARAGSQSVWIKGPVLYSGRYEWWSRLQVQSLGSPEAPRRGVIEPELETRQEDRSYYGTRHGEHVSRLPFVRVFSLDTKRYVYVDNEDLVDYEFDDQAIGRLHLPERMMNILTTVFTAPAEAVFGDVIAGKHGGLVILAAGSPGVGKTLTAEVYAEITGRPLYVLELGELGTNASDVEENLTRVFTRVAQWNAVLQFDECEIFLAIRGDDLERSAIVGIFLRLLDYYRGILFLTTNRPEVLDPAVMSRVTLQLRYPDLTPETRREVWRTMLNVAGLGELEGDWKTLIERDLNGRQIRNLVRLAKVVHGDRLRSVSQLIELADTAVMTPSDGKAF